MGNSLDTIVNNILGHSLDLFREHPEMQKLLKDMSFAVCADLKGIDPGENLFPKLLTDKGIDFFEANFNAFLGQIQSIDPAFKIACKSGCSFCCSSHITIMPQEAFNICLHLARNYSTDAFTEIAEQCYSAAKELENTTLKKYAETYFSPCPFLIDNECSIYEVRPIVCRNWISSDVEICKQSYASKNKVTVPQNSLIMVQKDLIYAGQAAYLSEYNINGQICSFLPLLGEVMADFEGMYSRWLDGEKLEGQFNTDSK